MDNNTKQPLLKIEHLKQHFPVKTSWREKEKLFVKANDGIDLTIYQGETLGLVGESGCGKSTLGRTLLQLYTQTAGKTVYFGKKLGDVEPKYVEQVLNNLSKYKKEVADLKAKAEQAQQKAEASDQLEELNAAQKIKDEYDIKLADVTQIVGGYLLADDLGQVKKLFKADLDKHAEVRKVESRIEELEFKLKALSLTTDELSDSQRKAEADKLNQEKQIKEAELKTLQAEQEQTQNNIREFGKGLEQNPLFAEYEKARSYGIDLTRLSYNEMRGLRRDMQLIFQDPYSSLNPRMTVGQIVSEGLIAHGIFKEKDPAFQDYILDTIEKCGLAKYFVHRYPHQFSGGQRQRIGIARALALNPNFVVLDEAVSALDVSIQSQIINLLLDLKDEHNLTYLFISHDLSVIRYISDRVAVMYLGHIVELADTNDLYKNPRHPYTEALLGAIPTTDSDGNSEMEILEGDIPSPIHPPKGCKFHTRCKYATKECEVVMPLLEDVGNGHLVACHHKLPVKN